MSGWKYHSRGLFNSGREALRIGLVMILLVLAVLFAAGDLHAQTVYPTAAGQNVKVAGTVPLQCDANGANCAPVSVANPVVMQPAAPANTWAYAAASGGIVNTTTAVTVKAAAGAGVRNYTMSMQCSHDTLGGATELALRDGAAGTVLWRGRLQTASTDLSGATINFEPPLRGSAATLTELVTLSAVTGGVYCNVQGFTGN